MLHTPSHDPWNILERMALDTCQIAHPLPRSEKTASWTGIALQLGEENFFIPLNILVEILREPLITQIPGMQEWLLGITHLRGELLVVSDIHDFLAHRNKALWDKTRILVVRHEGDLFGVLVDHIFGLVHFSSEQYSETLSVTVSDPYRPFVKAQLQEGSGKIWPLLDLREIISLPTFKRASMDDAMMSPSAHGKE